MSKATVTRIFIGGSLAVLAGAVLGAAIVGVAIANDVFVVRGADIVALRGGALTWALLGLGIAAGGVMLAGMIGGVVAWVGALLNASRLESRRWFVGLLVLGIFSLGFVAMIAYVVAGPDGAAGPRGRRGAQSVAPTPA